MKKKLALVLAGVMAAASLTGCGGGAAKETTAAPAASGNAAPAATEAAAPSDVKPELNLIIASNQTSLDNPYSYGMDKFKEVVEEKSGGKIQVTVHKGTLGENENELIEKLEMGAASMVVASPGFMTAIGVPEVDIFSLEYLFDSFDHWEKCLDGEFGDKMKDVVKEKTGNNFRIMAYWSSSVRDYYGKKPVTKPEDLKGMNIRVPGANIFIDLYRNYFGANPTAMDFSEVYTSLQQKTIDGQENPIAVFDSSKFAEVQQYVTLWDGVRDTTIWVMSQKTMKKLSPEDQALVKECASEALDWGNDYLADNEEAIIQKLRDGGTTITDLTDEQKAEFQKACAGIYDDYARSVGQDVIDLFTGGYKE